MRSHTIIPPRLVTSLSGFITLYKKTAPDKRAQLLDEFKQALFLPCADIPTLLDNTHGFEAFQAQYGSLFSRDEERKYAYYAIFDAILEQQQDGRVFDRNIPSIRRSLELIDHQPLVYEHKAAIVGAFTTLMDFWAYEPRITVDMDDEAAVSLYFDRLTSESDFPTEAFAPRTQTPEGQRRKPETE